MALDQAKAFFQLMCASGPNSEVESHSRRVRSTPMNGHRQTGPTGPFRATETEVREAVCPHQFIVAAIKDINSGSSASSPSQLRLLQSCPYGQRLVLIPTVAIPAEDADLTPERESSKAIDRFWEQRSLRAVLPNKALDGVYRAEVRRQL